jgi:hypothetical protein
VLPPSFKGISSSMLVYLGWWVMDSVAFILSCHDLFVTPQTQEAQVLKVKIAKPSTAGKLIFLALPTS